MAAAGKLNVDLLEKLNALDYYQKPYPRSLDNEFGTDIVYPMIRDSRCEIPDALRTYVEHISGQIKNAIKQLPVNDEPQSGFFNLMVTGGGAFNRFLVQRIEEHLQELNIKVLIPDEQLVNYKESLVMALFASSNIVNSTCLV